MAAHGTRSRYREGCRCTTCKEAESAYYRQHRDRGGAVKALVGAPGAAPGPVEEALVGQLAGLSAAVEQPALAQAALAMARLLDSDRSPSSHPMAAGRLADLLDRLRKGSDLRKSNLTAVRQMSKGDLGATG